MDFKAETVFVVMTTLLSSYVIGVHSNRVLLRDISALTLRHGMQTNARRSGSVPQLKCVGGTAGCSAFVPQVVQCQNKGFDGYDVQWECKTDMDNAYRFGQVEVTCEGFEYPDDPYVLRGSCGLEYTLDLTKEGYQQNQQKQHQHYGQQNHGDDYHDRNSDYYKSYSYKKSSSGFGSLLYLGGAAFVIYLIYKTCLAPNPPGPSAPNPDDPPPYSRHDQGQAPPPGFKPEFTSSQSSSGYSGFSGGFANPGYTNQGYTNQGHTNTGYTNQGHTNNGTTGGGFWGGMATGGLLGYLFGNSGNRGYNSYGYGSSHRPRHYGSSWGNSWFGGNTGSWGNTGSSWGSRGRSSWGSSSGWGSSSSSSSNSTGTRTASGFGGTKRR